MHIKIYKYNILMLQEEEQFIQDLAELSVEDGEGQLIRPSSSSNGDWLYILHIFFLLVVDVYMHWADVFILWYTITVTQLIALLLILILLS